MIWYWQYQLTPKKRLSAVAADAPRQGALIRVDRGFADVHPWPELGDEPLDEQLELLRHGETTPLTLRSLAMARLDEEARRADRSLFEGLTIPRSHWPAAAGEVPFGFDTVKLKMWRGAAVDSSLAQYRLRLDFNATLSQDEFLSFARSLPANVRHAIDFVEDPCPYDGRTWMSIRETTGIRLGLDRGDADDGIDVLVVKPAIQELPRSRKEIVVTSYMDHPIGQLGAAYIAAKSGIGSTCGLVTHVLYESDPFIDRMRLDGARLESVGGMGVGFDDLLEKLPWKKLG
jgi:O-succinylbenzoate synthase